MRSLSRVIAAVPGTTCVRQRRLVEVSHFEQFGDPRQVLSDRVKVRMVARFLHCHLDGPAVLIQLEVMDRTFLIEAHRLGAARKQVAVMGFGIVRLPRLWLLRLPGTRTRSRLPRQRLRSEMDATYRCLRK
jgi:hypothetical protein